MTFTLELLPANPKLEFIEEGHKYIYHDSNLGDIEPKSVSTVLAATEAKCFNYGIWRNSLMKQGLSFDQAEAFMAWHKKSRAQVGTHFHSLAEKRFKLGDSFCAESFEGKFLPEAFAIFKHFNESFVPRIRKIYVIETPMIHGCFVYTGTPDLVAVLDDESIWMIDYKTIQNGSNSYAALLYWLEFYGLTRALQTARENPPNIAEKNARSWRKRQEWVLQIAAYIELVRFNHGIKITNAGNLVLSDAKHRLLEYNEADLIQAWDRYAGFLLEYHYREASLGNDLSALALNSVKTMFRATVR